MFSIELENVKTWEIDLSHLHECDRVNTLPDWPVDWQGQAQSKLIIIFLEWTGALKG